MTPPGVIAAGDGFTQWMDRIVEGFERMRRCMDDTLLYDTSIKDQFFRVCKFLQMAGEHGCIHSTKKLKFCEKTVEFVGYQLMEVGIKPLSSHL